MADRYLPDDWVLPQLSEANESFFTEAALRVQRCEACGTVQHPPNELCHRCQSFDLAMIPVSGGGTVVSASIVHHASHPVLRESVPYNVVIVALDEHPHVRIVGNVAGVPLDEVRIGLAVSPEWAPAGSAADDTAVQLLQWRRAEP